jgi:hypothetical protein
MKIMFHQKPLPKPLDSEHSCSPALAGEGVYSLAPDQVEDKFRGNDRSGLVRSFLKIQFAGLLIHAAIRSTTSFSMPI